MATGHPLTAVDPKPGITRVLQAISQGEQGGTERLLPLVYEELRKLAAARMAGEAGGQTLQATALVHEAYLRLLGDGQTWENRGHFFAAAAEAMRRILIENARRRVRLKNGGAWERIEFPLELIAQTRDHDTDLLELDSALADLEAEHPRKAQLVKLRYFAGLSEEEAALALGISRPTASRDWAFAKAWLFSKLQQ